MRRSPVLTAIFLLLPALAVAQSSVLDRAAVSAQAAVLNPDPSAAAAKAGETLDGVREAPAPIEVRAGLGRKSAPMYSSIRVEAPKSSAPPAPAAKEKPSRLKAIGLALWSPLETPITMMVAIGIW